MNWACRTAVAIVVLLAHAPGAFAQNDSSTTTFKLYRAGSSSFPYDIIEQTRSIIEAAGDYRLICDSEADGSGYVRLDEFITKPGLYEEWTEKYIPRIAEGNYDYVVFQTIGWLRLNPEQQAELCTEILPDLTGKIEEAGAELILYDKYLPVERRQSNPEARDWCYRYPDGERLNYLLHIMAAKESGFDKITFGGEAVNALWQHDMFRGMDELYAGGHPGVFANYITAVNLAYVLTGESPVGSPVRDLAFHGWLATNFHKTGEAGNNRLYDANIGRVDGNTFTLRDAEAELLQTTAAASYEKWDAVLRVCLTDEQAYAQLLADVRSLQAEMDKYEAYGLDEQTITKFKQEFAKPDEPGELRPAALRAIRRQVGSIRYVDTKLRNYSDTMLSQEEARQLQREYSLHWDQHNSKLRDDVYLEARMLEAELEKAGKRDEMRRVGHACSSIRHALSLPGFRMLLERVTDAQRAQILADYHIDGPQRGYAPQFADYQNEHHNDLEKLTRAWEVYLSIWEDADFMDKVKAGGFQQETILEADAEFARRIAQ